MKAVHPVYLPTPYQDTAELGRVVLRDGSSALVYIGGDEDLAALRNFYASLSERSRIRRFNVPSIPNDQQLLEMLDSANLGDQCCLLVKKQIGDESRVIASATYSTFKDQIAEFAVTVSDEWQGRGLGTLLLERLSLIAIRNGIRHFEAYTAEMNRPMLDVFRHSGFPINEDHEEGTVTVDLAVVPSESSVHAKNLRDRLYTAASLQSIFAPTTITIIDDSVNPESPGRMVHASLVNGGYTGDISTLFNSEDEEAPESKLQKDMDLVVLSIAQPRQLAMVKLCGQREVRGLVILPSVEWVEDPDPSHEHKLLDLVRRYGIRLIGPNSLGVLNTKTDVSMNASLSPLLPVQGRIAMASQSGGLGQAILSRARDMELGFSSYVNMGNKVDVSGNDLLLYWLEDQETDITLMYLEGFNNPRRFARIARLVSRTKPIVCVKSGRYSRATTEDLSRPDELVDALFHQTGVIRAGRLEDMFSIAQMLDVQPLPKGTRTAILSHSGGAGLLCADSCLTVGLTPSADTDFPRRLPAASGPDDYQREVFTLLSHPDVDQLIVVYTPVSSNQFEAVLEGIGKGVDQARDREGAPKPVACVLMRGASELAPLTSPSGERIPVFSFPETAARVFQKIGQYAQWKAKPPGQVFEFEDVDVKSAAAICSTEEEKELTTEETHALLNCFKLPLGHPNNENTIDLMLTATEDSPFGPLLGLGLSTLHRDVQPELVHRVTPLEDRDAREILQEFKGSVLLKQVNPDPLEELILRVSMMVEELPAIKNLELNPIQVNVKTGDVTIADSKTVITSKRHNTAVRYSNSEG